MAVLLAEGLEPAKATSTATHPEGSASPITTCSVACLTRLLQEHHSCGQRARLQGFAQEVFELSLDGGDVVRCIFARLRFIVFDLPHSFQCRGQLSRVLSLSLASECSFKLPGSMHRPYIQKNDIREASCMTRRRLLRTASRSSKAAA